MRWVLLVFGAVLLVTGQSRAQGNPVGPEFRVNSYTSSDQYYSSIAASGGSFVVVWTSRNQYSFDLDIYGQRYTTGGIPLGPEFRVNTYTPGGQYLPTVSSDPFGNFVVLWMGEDQAQSFGAFGQRYSSTGTPLGPEFRVNTNTTDHQVLPRAAFDPAGNFVVTWASHDQDGSSWGAFGQRYAGNGTPLGAEFRVNTYTTGRQYEPVVSTDTLGNFVIAWDSDSQDGSGRGVFARRFASTGAPLGPEFRVNTYTTGFQYRPAVSSNLAGDFVVVWVSSGQYGPFRDVFGQRFDNTGALVGPEFRVNTYTPGYQDWPAIAMDGNGDFVVVWASDLQEGSSWGVFGQRYDSTSAPLGGEFRINTYTTNYQTLPAVASDIGGTFAVAWSSVLQDGAGWGVFAQRYNPILPVELMHFKVD